MPFPQRFGTVQLIALSALRFIVSSLRLSFTEPAGHRDHRAGARDPNLPLRSRREHGTRSCDSGGKGWWKLFLWAFFFVGCSVSGFAQNLKGHIVGPDKKPLSNANVFVRETTQGVAANEDGDFQLFLPAGNYTCEVSSLGYEKRLVVVQLTEKPQEIEIILQQTSYMLPEVRISSKGEDPAYYAMRKAIARAPFHRNQVEAYVAEVYTKGKGKVDKIPKVFLMGLSAEERKEVNALIGKLLMLESVTGVKFKAPEHYENTVIAFSSTMPEEMDPKDALGIITASIYDPSVLNMTSPLSPGAFSLYRFRFMEAYLQDGRTITKIQLEPKRKNNQLFSGVLHIEDEDWSVVNFDLTAEILGSTARFKTMFNEVRPGVYLPTSYDISVEFKLIGVAAQGKYYSSLKYSDIQAKTSDKVVSVLLSDIPEQTLSPKQEKSLKKLEELSRKEELTTKEAYQMARLTQDVIEESRRGDTVPPLEIRPLGISYKVEADSLATKRDSAFWMQFRTIPLNTEEKRSYKQKDSLQFRFFSGRDSASYSRNQSNLLPNLLVGGVFYFGKKVNLRVDGLIGAVPEYNFVDGFWIGQRADLNIRLNDYQSMEIKPFVHFLTARKTVAWGTEVIFPYFSKHNATLSLSVGDKSMDFKQSEGTLRLENALTSLVDGCNFMKFYRAKYVRLYNSMELFDGLILDISGEYQKRYPLENRLTYSFFGGEVEPNIPDYAGGMPMPVNRSAKLKLGLRYNPRMYYRMRGDRKEYVRTEYPTFYVNYERGFPGGKGARSDYHRIEAGVRQSFKPTVFSRLNWGVFTGKFFSVKEMYFPDYKHFGTSGWLLNNDGFSQYFFLGDYYRFATHDKWLRAGVNFRSSYLLFKNIPALQSTLFDEALHLRYLWTPELKNYLELGYSIGLNSFTRIGVFVGFERMRYESIGVRFNIPLGRTQ